MKKDFKKLVKNAKKATIPMPLFITNNENEVEAIYVVSAVRFKNSVNKKMELTVEELNSDGTCQEFVLQESSVKSKIWKLLDYLPGW